MYAREGLYKHQNRLAVCHTGIDLNKIYRKDSITSFRNSTAEVDTLLLGAHDVAGFFEEKIAIANI